MRTPPTSADALATNPAPDALSELYPQISPLGILPQHWQIRPVMPLGPNPNTRLGFQASIPRGLFPKPSRLRAPESHPWSLPATQEETVPFRAVQIPQCRRNMHAPLRHPHLQLSPGYKPRPDTPFETLPPLSTPGIPHQHQQNGPDMP